MRCNIYFCFCNIQIIRNFNKINLIENGVDPASYTDPSQAQEFITSTQADLLAVSIGNLHGLDTDIPEVIDLNILQKITDLIPSTLFTLHGGSGISADQIRSAISMGIVKININTDLRLQFKKSLISTISTVNSEKLYDYFYPVIADVKQVVIAKLVQFSTNNKT